MDAIQEVYSHAFVSVPMGFFFSRLIRFAVLAYVLFAGTSYILREKGYSFSPKEFRSLAEKNKGEGLSSVHRLAADLRKSFGPLVSTDLHWTAFQAGGLQLKALVLHGGITEFILGFYAPFATTGRTGLHFANSTCTVMSGSVKRASDISNSEAVESLTAGSNFRVSQFESSLVSLSDKTVVVCYGRGLIPVSSLWTLPSNLLGGDPLSTLRFHFFYLRSLCESLSHSTGKLVDHVKRTYLKTEL